MGRCTNLSYHLNWGPKEDTAGLGGDKARGGPGGTACRPHPAHSCSPRPRLCLCPRPEPGSSAFSQRRVPANPVCELGSFRNTQRGSPFESLLSPSGLAPLGNTNCDCTWCTRRLQAAGSAGPGQSTPCHGASQATYPGPRPRHPAMAHPVGQQVLRPGAARHLLPVLLFTRDPSPDQGLIAEPVSRAGWVGSPRRRESGSGGTRPPGNELEATDLRVHHFPYFRSSFKAEQFTSTFCRIAKWLE